MTQFVTLEEIRAAHENLPAIVRRTPIVPLARTPSEIGRESLYLKLENLQVTGAYKVRAAFNTIRVMGPQNLKHGLVLTSSGNFAQAFALAGQRHDIPIVVVMMDRTSPFKVEAARGYGAEVVFCGNDALARQPAAEAVARERGMTVIDTWEERPIPAGHGSLGLELLDQMPDVEQVLVPVSSSGLIAGVATAIKESAPHVAVIGVQPERANAAYVSLRAGTPATIDYWDSIADGLSAVRPGAFPFAHVQRYVDEIVLVTEIDIESAFRTLLYRGKVLGEPAGVVAAAGFLSGRVSAGKKTVALVTGGNITPAMVQRLLVDPESPDTK
ncbi:MAG: threonine/serine dehydratase [Alphaproteobacteria bacterium]